MLTLKVFGFTALAFGCIFLWLMLSYLTVRMIATAYFRSKRELYYRLTPRRRDDINDTTWGE